MTQKGGDNGYGWKPKTETGSETRSVAKESEDDLKKGMNVVYAQTVILITDYIPIVIGL